MIEPNQYPNFPWAETIIVSTPQATPLVTYVPPGQPMPGVLKCGLNFNYPKTLFYFLAFLGGIGNNGANKPIFFQGNINLLGFNGQPVLSFPFMASNPNVANNFGKSLPCLAGATGSDYGDVLMLNVGNPLADITYPEANVYALQPRTLAGFYTGATLDITNSSSGGNVWEYGHLFMGFYQTYE
jgi:hypothetical protein